MDVLEEFWKWFDECRHAVEVILDTPDARERGSAAIINVSDEDEEPR